MPVAGRTRKDVVTEFREAEILQAARHVFAQKGFADSSMEEIAHSAGLAKGTLYLYYPSKRELYRAALRAGLVELCEALEQAIAKAATLSAQLEAYVTTNVAFFDENRDFCRIYLAEFGQAACGAMDPYFRDLSLRQSGLLEAAIREGLKGASGKGALAQEAAHAVSDLTRGVILRRLMGWSPEPRPEKEVAFVVEFAKKALGLK